jgi:hypothetical protein
MGRYLSGTFSNKNSLNQAEALLPYLFNFVLDCHMKVSSKKGGSEISWYTSDSDLC